MQKLFVYICALLVGVVATPAYLYAQASQLSEEHQAKIVANCTYAQASLEQLRRSDASTRVHRGQLYESVGIGLMAAFNSRVALNRMDGSALVSAASQYEDALHAFRDDYRTYEVGLSRLLRISCNTNPSGFYTSLLEVRELREEVHARIGELHEAMDDYIHALDEFIDSYQERRE